MAVNRSKAAKKAAQTRLEIKYAKEQIRLLDFQKALEAEGYRFSGSALPKAPKKITPGSVRKLQNITPEYVLKQATFLDDETGRITGGLEQYKKRATVALKPPAAKQYGRKKKTTAAKRIKQKKPKIPRREDIVINNFEDLIDQLGKTHTNVKNTLLNLLKKEIAQYGKTAVAMGIEAYPIEEVQEAIAKLNHYGMHDDRGTAAYNRLREMITNEIPTMEEMKDLADAVEEDDNFTAF